MHDNVLSRPMFQTPGERAGSGIMGGVAPVNMQDGGWLEDVGDMASSGIAALKDWGGAAGEFAGNMATGIGNLEVADDFFSLGKSPEGTVNLRDITDFLIADPTDPVDVALAAVTAPLWIFPPAAIAARLAVLGYKGSKVARILKKVVDVQEKVPTSVFVREQLKKGAKGLGQAGLVRSVPEGVALAQAMTGEPDVDEVSVQENISERTTADGDDVITDKDVITATTMPASIADLDQAALAGIPQLPKPPVVTRSSTTKKEKDSKKKRRAALDLSKESGWFPGKRILKGIKDIGDDERWLAAAGGEISTERRAGAAEKGFGPVQKYGLGSLVMKGVKAAAEAGKKVTPGIIRRNPGRSILGGAVAGGLGAGLLGGGEEEVVAEEVLPQDDLDDDPSFWRSLLQNIGDLPLEAGQTIIGSMDRIKTDPEYRRAMQAAFSAMTQPVEGAAPVNFLGKSVEAFHDEMDKIKAGKSKTEEMIETLAVAYPDASEEELVKMALGKSKSDYIKEQLTALVKAGHPAQTLFEKQERIVTDDKGKETTIRSSAYDEIVKTALALQEKGVL
jgi:hypothetical protein